MVAELILFFGVEMSKLRMHDLNNKKMVKKERILKYWEED